MTDDSVTRRIAQGIEEMDTASVWGPKGLGSKRNDGVKSFEQDLSGLYRAGIDKLE